MDAELKSYRRWKRFLVTITVLALLGALLNVINFCFEMAKAWRQAEFEANFPVADLRGTNYRFPKPKNIPMYQPEVETYGPPKPIIVDPKPPAPIEYRGSTGSDRGGLFRRRNGSRWVDRSRFPSGAAGASE